MNNHQADPHTCRPQARRHQDASAVGAARLELTTLEPMVLLSASLMEFVDADFGDAAELFDFPAWGQQPADGVTLFGSDAADRLITADGPDVVFGESGDDWISTGGGNDSLFGGTGDDELEGGGGDDYLDGEGGNDIIDAGAGDDTIVLSDGHDVVFGGAGLDLVELYEAGQTVEIDLTTGLISGGLSASLDSVEAVLGSDQKDVFRFSAPQAGDVFYIHGGGGHDVIDLTSFGPGQVVQDGGHLQAAVSGGTVDIYMVAVEDMVLSDGLRSAGAVDFWSMPDEYRQLFDGFVEEIGPAPEDVSPTLVDGVATLDNYGPEAADDWASVPEDQTVRIDVLSNDSDFDNDDLTVSSIVAGPANGGVRINADGTLDYTPWSDFNGLDRLTYEVSDGKGGLDTAVVTIHVTPVNDAPQAVDDVYQIDADQKVTVVGRLVSNDTDPDGDSLRVIRVGDSSPIAAGETRTLAVDGGGLVSVHANGTMTFDPAGAFDRLPAGVTQDVVFEYEISDPEGLTSAAQVRVTVTGTNLAPTTVGEHWWVEYKAPTRVLGGLLFNDSDPNGDALSIASVNGDAGKVDPGNGSRTFDLPQGGRLQVTADGVVTFDPAGDFDHLQGEERQDVTFQYEVNDGRGGSAVETAMISVVGKNEGPVTEGEHWWVEYNQPSQVLGGVLFNDSDADGDALSIASVNGDAGKVDPGNGSRMFDLPQGGRLQVTADGVVTFDPAGDFDHLQGEERQDVTFQYEVSDGRGGTAVETAMISVVGKNQGPVTEGEHWWVEYNQPSQVLGGVLFNDSDADGDALSIAAVNGDAGKVDPGNGSRTFDLPQGGRLQVTADGVVTFDPAGDFDHLQGEERQDVTFQYEVSDGRGGTAVETAMISVVGKNQGPVTEGEHWWVEYSQPSQVLGGVLFNDSDADGDALSIAAVNGDAGNVDPGNGSRTFDLPQGGRLQVTSDGVVTFDPAGDFDHLQGEERQDVTFQYEVSDGRGGTAVETAMISVVGKNEAPVTQGEHWWVEYNQPSQVLGGVLFNDSDADGDALSIASVNGDAGQVDPGNGSRTFDLPQGGRLQVTADGVVTFDPAGDFDHLQGEERQDVTFQYEVSDGRGGSAVEAAMISVVGKNEAPVTQGEHWWVEYSQPSQVLGGVLFNDSDADGDALSIASVNGDAGKVDPGNGSRTFDLPQGGRLQVTADGVVTFDPAGDFDHLQGEERQDVTFQYEVSDGRGGAAVETAMISVVGKNQGPVTEGEHWWVEYDQPSQVLGGVLFNDSDADGDALSIASVNGDAGKVDPGNGSRTFDLPQGGRLQVTADGVVTFDPAGDFDHLQGEERQDVTFQYEVSDGRGGTAVETAMISVVGKNQGPVTESEHWWVEYNQPSQVLGGVLFNDSDADGDALTIAAVNGDAGKVDPGNGSRTFDLPQGGRLQVTADGVVTFDPAGDFDHLQGEERQDVTFQYEVSDGRGGTAVETAMISVVGKNQGPVTEGEHWWVEYNQPSQVLGGVLFNDSDADGDALSIASVNGDAGNVDPGNGSRTFDLPQGGRLQVTADGVVTFDPAGDFDHLQGEERQDVTFQYEVSDGRGGSAVETAMISVVGKNEAPVTQGEHWWVEYNQPSQVLGGVLFNDSDADGDALSIASVNGDAGKVDPGNGSRTFDLPQGGRLQVTADGVVTFDPAGDFDHLQGEERQDVTFQYEVSDGRGGTAVETAMISVVGKNQGPVTEGEHWWVEYNQPSQVLGGVLFNDSDADGDALSIASVNGDAGKVDPGNGSRTFDLPQGGRLQVTADGVVTFDPAGDFDHLQGEERQDVTFQYEVSDGRGGTAVETAMISVVGKNEAPVTQGEHWWVEYNQPSQVLGGVLFNDSDADGDALTIAAVNGDAGKVDPGNGSRTFDLPQGGRLQVTADGVVTFDPAGDFDHLQGEERQDVTFQYEVSDGRGGTAVETAMISVVGKNQGPQTVNDLFYARSDQGFLSVGRLLTNDSDPDGDELVVSKVNGDPGKVDVLDGSRTFDLDGGGRLNVYFDGNVVFDPAGDFQHLTAGQTQDVGFSYEVSDGRGGVSEATATIVVSGVNDGPIAVSDHFHVNADQGNLSIGRLLANDSDPDGDDLTVTAVNGDPGKVDTLQGMRTFDLNGGGRVNVYFDGNVLFDPAGDFDHLDQGQSQDVQFTYDISDGRGGTSTATVTITVAGTRVAQSTAAPASQPFGVLQPQQPQQPSQPSGYAAGAASGTGDNTRTSTSSNVDEQGRESASASSTSSGSGGATSSSSAQSGRGSNGEGLQAQQGGDSNSYSETDNANLTASSSGSNATAVASNPFRSLFSW